MIPIIMVRVDLESFENFKTFAQYPFLGIAKQILVRTLYHDANSKFMVEMIDLTYNRLIKLKKTELLQAFLDKFCVSDKPCLFWFLDFAPFATEEFYDNQYLDSEAFFKILFPINELHNVIKTKSKFFLENPFDYLSRVTKDQMNDPTDSFLDLVKDSAGSLKASESFYSLITPFNLPENFKVSNNPNKQVQVPKKEDCDKITFESNITRINMNCLISHAGVKSKKIASKYALDFLAKLFYFFEDDCFVCDGFASALLDLFIVALDNRKDPIVHYKRKNPEWYKKYMRRRDQIETPDEELSGNHDINTNDRVEIWKYKILEYSKEYYPELFHYY
ncbi:hypothetical protein [Carp edema virus]|nr:hypothetical protein [Carp edema virus]